jgi:hypothetical protein
MDSQPYSDLFQWRSGGLGLSHLRLESQLRDAKNDYSQYGVTLTTPIERPRQEAELHEEAV